MTPVRPPNTAALARLSATLPEREKAVLKTIGRLKSMYVETGREADIVESIQTNLGLMVMRHETGDTGIEVRGSCVTAPTGFGKSRVCEHVLGSMPIFAPNQFSDGTRPLVSIKCKSPCSLDSIGRQLLRATEYGADGRGIARGATTPKVWDAVADRFEMLGTILLHIDEVNSLTKGANVNEAEKINDNLKGILNRTVWPMVLLLSGTEEALPYLLRDKELVRRIDLLGVAPMTSPADSGFLAGIIEDLCKEASLAAPSNLERNLVPRLIHSTTGAVGWPVDVVIRSIEIALREGRAALSIEDFAKRFAKSTGYAADKNPFISDNWSATPPFPVPKEDLDWADGPGERRRRKGKS